MLQNTPAPSRAKSKTFSKINIFIFVLLFAIVGSYFMLSGHASPSTYYVSTSGSDSASGAQSAPWKTIGKGIASMHAGDTLIVGGGTYAERIQTGVAAGTSSAPITVKAASGQRPIIQGLLWLNSANYWKFDGINVTWSSSNSNTEHMIKMTSGTGWSISNAEIWGAHSYAGILVAGTPSGWRIDHNYIHDTYSTNMANQDHLIYVNGGTGGGVIERNIFANSTNGRGVKIGPPSGGTSPIGNVTIRYNTFYNNTGPSNIQLSYGASGNQIYRNIMVKSGAANITAYNLNGKNNQVHDNIGWQASAVVDSDPGVVNGGNNVYADPQLNLSTFKPGNSAYAEYGRYASGDNGSTPVPTPTPTPTPTPPPTPTPTPTPTPAPGDTTAPTAPSNVQAKAFSASQVGLTWSASTDNVGVTGYNIYRGTSTTPLAKVGAVTSFADNSVAAGTSYSYQVQALDKAGNKSAKSVAVNITTPAKTSDTTPPTVNITAPASGSTVANQVSITADAQDNVAVAQVEFSIDSVLKATVKTTPYSYAWNVAGLVGTHTVSVRAVDTSGNAKVATVTVTTNSPVIPTPTLPKPLGLTATAASSTQVNLSWQAVASAASYDIYRGTAKIGNAATTSYGDAIGLKASTSYSYSIVARDALGHTSPHSDTATVKTAADPTPTPTPTPTPNPTPAPQSGKGSLTGTVRGSSNKALKGAKVTIKVSGKTVTATTNSNGVYSLKNEPAGSYAITYSASGYKTNKDNVRILANSTKTKNKTLAR